MSEKYQQQDTGLDTLQGALEKEKVKREKERREVAFNDGLKQLANKVIDEMERDQDSIIAEVLVTFLDVALEMKNMMTTMQAINTAMQCLGDAIGFLDQALKFDEQLVNSTLEVKYGIISRWKQKRKNKKAIKNNMNRMEQAIQNITLKYQMATSMLDMFVSMNEKLHKMMNIRMVKRAKKQANDKTKPTASMSNTDSPARKMIAKLRAQRGLTTESNEGSGSNSSNDNRGGSGRSGRSDNSDILD